jgi:hypothetical protein
MERPCELARLNDSDRLYDVQRALAARGIEAEVWDLEGGARRRKGDAPGLRLMVRREDLVYARWVAHAAGLDTWGEAPPDEEAA